MHRLRLKHISFNQRIGPWRKKRDHPHVILENMETQKIPGLPNTVASGNFHGCVSATFDRVTSILMLPFIIRCPCL